MPKFKNSMIRKVLIDLNTLELRKIDMLPKAKFEYSHEYIEMINALTYRAEENERNLIAHRRRIKNIIIAIILSVSALAALVACVKPLREFIIQITEHFTTLTPDEDNEIFFETIETVYKPSAIPEEAILLNEEHSDVSSTYIWLYEDNTVIFNQSIYNDSIFDLDTETSYASGNKKLSNINVHYTIKNNTCSVIWIDKGYAYNFICSESLGWEWIEEAITSLEIVDVEIQTNN